MNDSSDDTKSMMLMLMLLPLATFSSRTQSNEDIRLETRASDPSDEFRLLTESEAQLHHATQYDEIVGRLGKSRLKKTHKDLIADALSKVMSGVPIGSFRRTEITEQTDEETDEYTNKFAVVETGHVENLETGSKTHFSETMTPFYIAHTLPFNFDRGRVSAQNETDITFCFRIKTEFSLEDIPQEFIDVFVTQKNIRWAMELTIDKDDRTVKRASLYLERPLRKFPLYRVDTLRTTFDFEFMGDCGCVGVSKSSLELSGSLISVGRIMQRTTETYTDVKCEKPLRYLHL